MSYSYIPEDTYAVCTFQMDPSPQKFIASRSSPSAMHKGKFLLTKEDKNLNERFTCKSPVNIAASLLAFGAGLALVVSGPVGWTIAGAALIGAALYTVKVVTHKCTSPMQAGSWQLYHETVRLDGHHALTQVSLLSCDNGGVLKPFFSYSLALTAAKQISNNNLTELGVNVVASFFGGLLLPAGIGAPFTKFGIWKGAGALILGNVAGLGVTWTAQYGQRGYMRGDSELAENEVYKNMNETVDPNAFFQTIDKPADLNDADALTSFSDAVNNGEVAVDNQKLKSDLSKLDGMSNYKLRKSELAKQIFKDLNDGKYGQETKSQIQSKFARWVGNNQKNVISGRQVAANNLKSALRNMGKNTGKGALFFLPFLGTYFSESARKSFAEEAVKDITNGLNVVAQRPLG